MSSLLQKKFFQKKTNNRELIGKLLLGEEYGKSNSNLKERKINQLPLMETLDRKIQFLAIMKKYQSIINKNQKDRKSVV